MEKLKSSQVKQKRQLIICGNGEAGISKRLIIEELMKDKSAGIIALPEENYMNTLLKKYGRNK